MIIDQICRRIDSLPNKNMEITANAFRPTNENGNRCKIGSDK